MHDRLDADTIKQQVSILTIARGYTALEQRTDQEWRGLCPLHQERTPSFDVNTEKQVFLCRGCGATGDVFDLVQQVEGVSFEDALRRVADSNGHFEVPVEIKTRQRPKAQSSEPKTEKVYDTRNLSQRGHDMAYLGERFGLKRCRTEKLGEYWQYPTFDANMIARRGRQKFRYPDKSGKKYRWVPGDNEPEPCGYPLWILRGHEVVWLVNGEPSVWLCWQSNVPAVCTLSETSYSRLPELMETLLRCGVNELHILLDNDGAGRRGTVQAYRAAEEAGLLVTAHKWMPEDQFKPGYDVADLHQDENRDTSMEFGELLLATPEATAADMAAWMGEPEPEDVRGDPAKFRRCPDCGAFAIKHGKKEYGGGWFCDKKVGGCGKRYAAEDDQINEQRPPESETSKRNTPAAAAVASQASSMLDDLANNTVIRTAAGEGYVLVRDDHGEYPLRIDEREFDDYCVLRAADQGQILKPDALSQIKMGLGAKARLRGTVAELFLRVGGSEDRVYIDLCNSQREVVEIDPSGWRVLPSSPEGIYFRRPTGQLAMSTPVKCRNEAERVKTWESFYDLLQPGSMENWVKMVSWILQCFRSPESPYIGLCVKGMAGSGKSQRCQMLVYTVNPFEADLIGEISDPRSFPPVAFSTFVMGFENLSHIPQWLSDALCQIATRAKFAMRKMRTNLELEIFDAKRPILVNGITDFLKAPDLKRRFMFIDLPRFGEGTVKRSEIELRQEFHRLLPKVLGVIFDCVSHALRRRGEDEITAIDWRDGIIDFGRWVTAAECEGGLPWPAGTFRAVYEANIQEAAEAGLADSSLSQAILECLKFEEGRGRPARIEMAPQQLYNHILHFAIMAKIDRDQLRRYVSIRTDEAFEQETTSELWLEIDDSVMKTLQRSADAQLAKDASWPKNPVAMGRLLQREANQLAVLGIKVKSLPPKSGQRRWLIERVGGKPEQLDIFDDEE